MELIFKLAFYIAILSIEYLATTSTHISVVEHIWDKANHAFAFVVLYVLLSFAYKGLSTLKKSLLLLLFGIQIEIVQYFLSYREFSLLDIFADSIGIFIGAGLFFIRNRNMQ